MVKNHNKCPDKVTIKIPRPLYDKVVAVIEDSGYNSVTDFVVYVMRDLMASHEVSGKDSSHALEIEKVKQRLRAMGYI
jgi:hypothetical protein